MKEDTLTTGPIQPKKNIFREYGEAILIAVVLAVFIRTFVVQAFKIPSGSMKPTLLVGDHILVNKFIYGVKLPFSDGTLIPIKDPKRGDIVVFKFPEDPKKDFIKRVIAVAGVVSSLSYRATAPTVGSEFDVVNAPLDEPETAAMATIGDRPSNSTRLTTMDIIILCHFIVLKSPFFLRPISTFSTT